MSIKNPLVSIVIPVYNGADFVKNAIESALNQTYKNIEIIVVNDGSDDCGKTEEKILEFGNKVRYFYKENAGVSSALNLGIKNMKGDYFAWLSHDDIFLPLKIEKQIELINMYGEETVIYGNFNYIDECDNYIGKFRADQQFTLKKLEYSRFPVYQGLIHGCTTLFHKDHFSRVGLFDESLKTSQDFDFWWRLFYQQKIKFISKVYTSVRKHPNQGTNTEKTYKTEENNYFLHFIKDINEKEIKNMYTSLKNFYWQMYMLCESNEIYKAASYALEKFDEQMYEAEENLKDIFNTKYQDKKFVIFGMGFWGKRIYKELIARDISVEYFLDNDINKNGISYGGITCKRELDDKSKYVVIVAVQNDVDIIEQLKKNAYPFYITYFEIINYLFSYPPIRREEIINEQTVEK